MRSFFDTFFFFWVVTLTLYFFTAPLDLGIVPAPLVPARAGRVSALSPPLPFLKFSRALLFQTPRKKNYGNETVGEWQGRATWQTLPMTRSSMRHMSRSERCHNGSHYGLHRARLPFRTAIPAPAKAPLSRAAHSCLLLCRPSRLTTTPCGCLCLQQYLDSQISPMDIYYLEDQDLARQLVELGYRGRSVE